MGLAQRVGKAAAVSRELTAEPCPRPPRLAMERGLGGGVVAEHPDLQEADVQACVADEATLARGRAADPRWETPDGAPEARWEPGPRGAALLADTEGGIRL